LPLVNKLGLIDIFIKLGFISKEYKTNWPKFELVDIRKKLPLKRKSVDYVYCSHVLEHFEKYETLDILKEIKRVLKKNGWLRLVLPDLEKMVGNYQGADNFCKEFFGFDKDKKYGLARRFIREHNWMYDEKSLREILKIAGFKTIKKCEFRQGKCEDIDKLDYEGHRNISMYFEIQ
jgi:predicted SAM-dependent methyltransferase